MHTMLPRHLNQTYDMNGEVKMAGALLHTKFLNEIIAKSAEERQRGEHFGDPDRYAAYYEALVADPILWTENSYKFEGWEDLVTAGLMEAGEWAIRGE
jgi:hypothetical protein